MSNTFSIKTNLVPAKARAASLQGAGNVSANFTTVVSESVGASQATASTIINNYYTTEEGGKGHNRGRVNITDLLGLPADEIEENDIWVVYSTGSDETGWSDEGEFVLNGKTYPDKTQVQRLGGEWVAIDDDSVNLQRPVILNPPSPDLLLTYKTFDISSYWNISGNEKPGIKLLEMYDFDLDKSDVYQLNFYKENNRGLGTPIKTLIVPFAYRETVDGEKVYHGGALSDTDYKYLIETASGGGASIDIQDYIDTAWPAAPTNDRVPASKLVYDGLMFVGTQIAQAVQMINARAKISDLEDYVKTTYLTANYYNKTLLDGAFETLQESIPTAATVSSWGFSKRPVFSVSGTGDNAEKDKWREVAYWNVTSSGTTSHSQVFAVANSVVANDKQFGLLAVSARVENGVLTHFTLNTDNPTLEASFIAVYNNSRLSIYAKQLTNNYGNTWNGWRLTTISEGNVFTQGANTATEEPTAGTKINATCYTQQVTAQTVENWGFAKSANIPVQFPTSDYVPVLGLVSGAVMRLHFSKLFTPLCLTYWSTGFNNDLCVVGAKLTLYITTDVTQDSQILICTKGGTGSYCFVISNEGMTQDKVYKFVLTVTEMQTSSAGYSYPNKFDVVRTVIE